MQTITIHKKAESTKHERAIVKSDFMSLAGKFHVKKPIPAEKIRDYIDLSWGKQ